MMRHLNDRRRGISALLLGAAVVLFMATRVEAQSEPQQDASFLGRFGSGSVGFTLEGYGVNGIPNRRPPVSLLTSAATSFDVYGLQSGFDLTYSTEGSGLRQSVNRVSFDTEWEWGRASVGTVSPALSTYSLNGETLRGGMLELSPGPLVATFAVGQAQRAVQPDPLEEDGGLGGDPFPDDDSLEVAPGDLLRGAAYERWLYAARLGVGRKEGTHFHLIGLVGRDDESSLNVGGLPVGEGSPAGEDLGVRPAENVSLTPSFGVRLFDGALRVSAEATASAFTRDTRAEALDLSEANVPGFLTSLFTPRTSSRFTGAGEAAAELSLRRIGVRVGYNRVQPGFRSMGRPQELGDREAISVRPRLSLFESRLNLTGGFERTRNNLLGQRASTLRRTQVVLGAQARVSQALSVSGSVMQMANDNEPASGFADEEAALQARLLERRTVVRVASLTPVLSLRSGQVVHTFTLSTSLQALTDESPVLPELATPRPEAGAHSLSSTLSYAFAAPSGLSVHASANVLNSDASRSETRVVGLNTGAGYAFLDRQLRTNASVGLAQTTNALLPIGDALETGMESTSRQLTTTLSASYSVWERSSLSLNVRGLVSQSAQAPSYQEMQVSLQFQHRF